MRLNKENKENKENKDIEKAISIMKSKNLAPIVKCYYGLIVLAQSENDFKAKVSKIEKGGKHIRGFITVHEVLESFSENVKNL